MQCVVTIHHQLQTVTAILQKVKHSMPKPKRGIKINEIIPVYDLDRAIFGYTSELCGDI